MAKSLTIDPAPRSDDRAEAELMELLMPKQAASLETNEKETTKGKAVVYNDPPDRPVAGSIDAPWGVDPNHPGDKMPNQARFGDAFKDLYEDSRAGLVHRVLSGGANAEATAQRTIAENFVHGRTGEFTTHSVLLRPKSIEKISHRRAETLSERVRNVTK